MLDVYSSLGSAQDSKCASSAILSKDFLTSSPPSYLGQQAPASSEKKFPTALVVGGLIVGGVILYYATQVGGVLGIARNNPLLRELTLDMTDPRVRYVVFVREGFSASFASKGDAQRWVKANDFRGARIESWPPRDNPGRAAQLGVTARDVAPGQLRRGVQHELEHTGSRKVAQQIALDHLAEDSQYYTHLEGMEASVAEEEPWGWWTSPRPYDNPKLQWQGSGSGSWARGAKYSYYRLLQRAPGEWVVFFDDSKALGYGVAIGAERTPALAKRIAQEHEAQRSRA